jgi:dCTP deaminase
MVVNNVDTGFLTAEEIKKEHARLFKKGCFDPERAENASYDLRLGEEVYISGEDIPRKLSPDSPFVSIPRGQFALLITREYITMPRNYIGLISIKLGIKLQGLINVSGFHVDPGFDGKLVFSVFNAGPTDVLLKYEDPTFMIFFNKLNNKAGPYKGEHKSQKHLPLRIVASIKGTSASLANVDERVHRLETTSKVYWALLIVLVGALIALFLRGAIGG